jgi:type VI secretion system protein ImpB
MAKDGSVGPRSRINIKYTAAIGDAQKEIELPLRMLVMGDFNGRQDSTPLADRKAISVNKDNFGEVMSQQKLGAKVAVKDKLTGDPDSQLAVNLKFDSLKDFTPGQVAHQVPELAKLMQVREALMALKNDLNKADFRKKLEQLVTDPELRSKLEGMLGE